MDVKGHSVVSFMENFSGPATPVTSRRRVAPNTRGVRERPSPKEESIQPGTQITKQYESDTD